MICSPFSRRGPSPAAEARSRRAQGGARAPVRAAAKRRTAKPLRGRADRRRPSANSRGGLRRGRIDPGDHRSQAIKLALEIGDAPFAKMRFGIGSRTLPGQPAAISLQLRGRR